ncbi:MAG: NAD-dependent malic enzyme [Methanomassiliicoccales archaeon]
MIGAGAANMAISRLLVAAGADIGRIVMTDSRGILGPWRKELKRDYREKWDIAIHSNREGKVGGVSEAIKDADVVIAASRPGPGIVTKSMVASMADYAIVFATANPIPEIWPWEAMEAGAKIVSTGRSDFPNQVNNSLAFPAIFRGVLDVRASSITEEMCLAAAMELALAAEEKGLSPSCIIPSMADWEVFPRVAVAVGMKAIEQGVAKNILGKKELNLNVHFIISRARQEMEA